MLTALAAAWTREPGLELTDVRIFVSPAPSLYSGNESHERRSKVNDLSTFCDRARAMAFGILLAASNIHAETAEATASV